MLFGYGFWACPLLKVHSRIRRLTPPTFAHAMVFTFFWDMFHHLGLPKMQFGCSTCVWCHGAVMLGNQDLCFMFRWYLLRETWHFTGPKFAKHCRYCFHLRYDTLLVSPKLSEILRGGVPLWFSGLFGSFNQIHLLALPKAAGKRRGEEGSSADVWGRGRSLTSGVTASDGDVITPTCRSVVCWICLSFDSNLTGNGQYKLIIYIDNTWWFVMLLLFFLFTCLFFYVYISFFFSLQFLFWESSTCARSFFSLPPRRSWASWIASSPPKMPAWIPPESSRSGCSPFILHVLNCFHLFFFSKPTPFCGRFFFKPTPFWERLSQFWLMFLEGLQATNSLSLVICRHSSGSLALLKKGFLNFCKVLITWYQHAFLKGLKRTFSPFHFGLHKEYIDSVQQPVLSLF